jgi:hypothetical protein
MTIFQRLLALAALLPFAAAPSCLTAQEQKPGVITFTVRKILEENVEGPAVPRTYFLCGRKRIVFGLPKGVRLSEGAASATLLLTDAGADGEVQVSRSPFTPETDFGVMKEKYQEAGAAEIPAGAADVQLRGIEESPYPYNGWSSMGFTWNYSFYGRPMTKTVSFINLEIGIQVKVSTSAVSKDEVKVLDLAKDFMRSWWVMGSLEPAPLPLKK